MFSAGATFELVLVVSMGMGRNRLPSSPKQIATLRTPCFKLQLDELSPLSSIINPLSMNMDRTANPAEFAASCQQAAGKLAVGVGCLQT